MRAVLSARKGTTEVKLNGRPLQKLHVKLIMKLLLAYPKVTSLELRGASLDDTCLLVICKFLRKQRFCALSSLDISENKFRVCTFLLYPLALMCVY